MIPASISSYLDRNGVRYSVAPHPAAYTAQQEAAAAHVPGGRWAKTVVCFADDQPILAVVPAPCAVDLDRLQRAVAAHSLRLAKESEFAPLYRDCEPGAVPPLGALYGQRVIVDKSLTAGDEIAFNGGSHEDAIRMTYGEFERLAHPTVAEFARTPGRRAAKLTDPVCGSAVDATSAAGRSQHRGETYYFCSQGCKMEFDDNPDAYA